MSDTPALPPLWKQRDYMLLWSGQVASTLGGSASGIVVPLLVLAMTGSASAAGIASALGIVPYIVLSLPVGVLVDRWHRQRVMVVCDIGRALACGVLVAALLFDALTLPLLYAVVVVQGVCMVFFNLAEVAALPRVVATAQLPQAIAQNQAGHSGAAIAGPALGTWMLQQGGRSLPFAADALGHLVSAWCVWRLRTPLASAQPADAPRNLRAEMAVGLRWLWQQPLVRRIAVITSLSNFVMAAAPLLVIVLAKGFGASEAQIGLVFSAGGLGGLLGALAGGWFARRFSFGQVIAGVLAVQALMLPLMVVAPGAWTLGVVYAVLAFCGPVYNVVQLSRRLAMIPDGLQGRVNSAFRFAANVLYPVGAALCGWLAEHHGPGVAAFFFTVVMAGLAVAAVASQVIRREGLPG
ncbi:MAG TPA: MFS transporter [Aquabacterium sp.]|nr:MFS transporter [Aquabacterium sp.]HQC98149.1 MFS transporter [Aquabacterium sp.]